MQFWHNVVFLNSPVTASVQPIILLTIVLWIIKLSFRQNTAAENMAVATVALQEHKNCLCCSSCYWTVSTGYTQSPAAQVSVQITRTVYIHRPTAQLSVQVTHTGLPLKCQHRLHLQACRPSVSTAYTYRPAAQVSVEVTLTGLPLKCQYRLHL